MKTVALTGWGQRPEVFHVEEPSGCASDECLVAMEYASIGNAEVWISRGIDHLKVGSAFQFPHTPGFRGAGMIIQAGEQTARRPGERVLLDGLVTCGRCGPCRRGISNLCRVQYSIGYMSGHTGCMSEVAILPGRQLYCMPEGLTYRDALIVSDIAASIAAFRRAGLRGGDSLVVIGAGRTGSMGIAVARALGATPILVVEPVVDKHAVVRELGADFVVSGLDANLDQARTTSLELLGEEPDIVLEYVGTPDSLALTAALCGSATRRIHFGVVNEPVSLSLHRDALQRPLGSLAGVWARTPDDFRRALKLAARRDLAKLAPIMEFDMDDAANAWEVAAKPGERVALRIGGVSRL